VLQVWLVGNGLTALEQERAQPGVHIVPYSQFPPMNTRGDCVYHTTPALVVPDSYENLHACEVTKPNISMDGLLTWLHGVSCPAIANSREFCLQNWLPRRVMSAWRAAGIVHALEKWAGHECGDAVTGVDKAWRAALAHGFHPYDVRCQHHGDGAKLQADADAN
jgi:aldehyde decarbonylase